MSRRQHPPEPSAQAPDVNTKPKAPTRDAAAAQPPRPAAGPVSIRTDDSRVTSANPALPHERDQGAVPTAGPVDPKIAQAHDDIVNGQVDTDLRATPGLDAQRRRRLVPGQR